MLKPETVLVQSKSLAVRDIDRVCFNKQTGCILQLNDSGYALLLHFETPLSVGNAVASMCRIFGFSETDSDNGIIDFIEYLISLNILALEDP
jgi:hypothetical protein